MRGPAVQDEFYITKNGKGLVFFSSLWLFMERPGTELTS